MDLLEKLNPHKRDKNIKFVEEGHKYYINGDDNYISATTFIHKLFPEFDSIRLINDLKRKHNKKYLDMATEEILELWENEKNASAIAGTKMHYHIELYSNDIPFKEINDNSIEFKYFLNFREKYPYLEPYRTEWTIYSKTYRIAGSIDMIYIDTRDNSYHIYDWKRSKQIWEKSYFDDDIGYQPLQHLPNGNYWHYQLQLNLYKFILEKNYNIQISSVNLCVCHPINRNFKIIKGIDLMDEIKTVLSIRKKQLSNGIYDFQVNTERTTTLPQNDDTPDTLENTLPKGICLID